MSTIMGMQPREVANLHLNTSPIHFKGLLVATDLSEQAMRALRIAAQLSKQFRSRLHILHAISPQVYAPNGVGLTPMLQEVDVEYAEAQLHKFVGKVPEARTVRHEEIVLCEEVIDAISTTVETKGIDLVVMGSHGRGGLGKCVLGSSAESAIRHLHCPVLVAGPNCAEHHGSLKSIVLATTLPAGSLRTAQYAMSIAQASGAAVTLLHVLLKDTSHQKDLIEREKEEARKLLRQLIPMDPLVRKQVRFEVAAGDRAEQIVRIATACKAGLIVMGVHEHSVLADHAPWATLSEVIRSAHCPVLAVRPHLV
jgi:nucleotide-binding universal stress UspA family protein